MPTLKGTEASLSHVQCFLYLVSSSINVSVFHITWLDTFWTDLIFRANKKKSNSLFGGLQIGKNFKVPTATTERWRQNVRDHCRSLLLPATSISFLRRRAHYCHVLVCKCGKCTISSVHTVNEHSLSTIAFSMLTFGRKQN